MVRFPGQLSVLAVTMYLWAGFCFADIYLSVPICSSGISESIRLCSGESLSNNTDDGLLAEYSADLQPDYSPGDEERVSLFNAMPLWSQLSEIVTTLLPDRGMTQPLFQDGQGNNRYIREWLDTLPLINAKQLYLDQVAAAHNHQIILLYPIQLTAEQQTSTNVASYIELMNWVEALADSAGTVAEGGAAQSDESFQQGIFNALVIEFDQMVSQGIPSSVAQAILTNNLVCNIGNGGLSASCPDCGEQPVDCSGDMEVQCFLLSQFEHSETCYYKTPGRCRHDPSEHPRAKTGTQTTPARPVATQGAVVTGGMDFIVEEIRNKRKCKRAIIGIRKDLVQPDNACWRILACLCTSNQLNLALSIVSQLISVHGYENVMSWMASASNNGYYLQELICFVESLHGSGQPPAEAATLTPDYTPAPNEHHFDTLQRDQDFLLQIPDGMDVNDAIAILKSMEAIENYAELKQKVLSTMHTVGAIEKQDKLALSIDAMPPEILTTLTGISGLSTENLKKLLLEVAAVTDNFKPYESLDDPRVFGQKWTELIDKYRDP